MRTLAYLVFLLSTAMALQVRGDYIHPSMTECGDWISDPESTMTSINYPNDPPRLRECYYYFPLDAFSTIEFEFNEPFGMEECCDWVQIDCELPRNESYRFTGYTTPTGFTFPHCRQFRITYTFLSSIPIVGFSLNYSSEPNCEETMNSTEGTVSSPNYPNDYPINTDCTTYIELPQYSIFTFVFASPFWVDQFYDWLLIVLTPEDCQGVDYSYSFYGDQAPPTLTLPYSCKAVQIVFHSDSSGQGAGFSLNYTSVAQP